MTWDDAGRTRFDEKLSWRVGRVVEGPTVGQDTAGKVA